ncbi:hypothetical protein [Nostoc favosum]|uniref:Uncharacterized protein n=1 Tax=Nostoc favosum CHAB5714 TaxID=2780399 RepID=A0ABS8IDU8_9NOSO|nr:hypothetical protein [Nostoc favosum]MCC5602211.1 hypothetical protein [Nostoc favosum CHAB5714]
MTDLLAYVVFPIALFFLIKSTKAANEEERIRELKEEQQFREEYERLLIDREKNKIRHEKNKQKEK